jgi:hypothetical protein
VIGVLGSAFLCACNWFAAGFGKTSQFLSVAVPELSAIQSGRPPVIRNNTRNVIYKLKLDSDFWH